MNKPDTSAQAQQIREVLKDLKAALGDKHAQEYREVERFLAERVGL